MDRVMVPTLVGDVLRVGVIGELDGVAVRLVLEGAARRQSDYAALLLDLTLAVPVAGDPRPLARLWLAHVPGLPCAALCNVLAADYAMRLALLLASSEAHPTPMAVFDTADRAAAWKWAADLAATYRDEQARRLRTLATGLGS